MGGAPLTFPGCCPESSVSRTALGAQRRESGAPPERDPLPVAGPAPKCPVHPSSWSRSCASPPSSANLGPNLRPSLTSLPHFPPAGCCPPALELCGKTAWEHLQESGNQLSAPASLGLSSNPRASFVCSEVPGLFLGSCCPLALPVSLLMSPPLVFLSATFPHLLSQSLPFFHIPAPLCHFFRLVPLATPLRILRRWGLV